MAGYTEDSGEAAYDSIFGEGAWDSLWYGGSWTEDEYNQTTSPLVEYSDYLPESPLPSSEDIKEIATNIGDSLENVAWISLLLPITILGATVFVLTNKEANRTIRGLTSVKFGS